MRKISLLLAAVLLLSASACSNKAAEEKLAIEKAEAEAAKAKAEAELAKLQAETAKAEAETAKAEAETAKAEAETAKADQADAEAQDAQYPIEPASLPDSDGALNPKGLLLEMGVRPEKGVETISTKGFDDGIYHVEEIYDGVISFATERRTSLSSNESEIQAAVSRFAPDARDITLGKDQKMSARLTYPAWKIEYLTGNNEDTRKNIDYYIHTEAFDYRFHTAIGVDQFDDNVHHLDAWFENLKMVER